MSYQDKYLLYKNKYLALKAEYDRRLKLKQQSGGNVPPEQPQIKFFNNGQSVDMNELQSSRTVFDEINDVNKFTDPHIENALSNLFRSDSPEPPSYFPVKVVVKAEFNDNFFNQPKEKQLKDINETMKKVSNDISATSSEISAALDLYLKQNEQEKNKQIQEQAIQNQLLGGAKTKKPKRKGHQFFDESVSSDSISSSISGFSSSLSSSDLDW